MTFLSCFITAKFFESLCELALKFLITQYCSQKQPRVFFLENSCTFNDTQNKIVNIVSLRKSCTHIVQNSHQGDLWKNKQIKSTQLYDKCYLKFKKVVVSFFDPVARVCGFGYQVEDAALSQFSLLIFYLFAFIFQGLFG